MKSIVYSFLIIASFLTTGCTSISKLYKSGSVNQDEFYGRTTFETAFDLIIVPVNINGKRCRFLFDTGAPMVISEELRDELELNTVNQGNVSDSQGERKKLDYVWLDKVTIGGVDFEKTGAVVADLNKAPEIHCMQIDGILGANMMKLAVWKIENQNKAMFFASSKEKLSVGDNDRLAIDFQTKTTYSPVIDLSISDSTTIKRVTFDTGYGGYLSLDGDYFDSTLTVLEKSYGYSSTGLYGSSYDTVLDVKTSMTFGDFNQVAPVVFSMAKSKNLLGMDFINQFDVVLDWNTNTIELYPVKLESQKIKSFGLTPKWNDKKLIVGSVSKGSLAEIDGIEVGDVIVKLNRWDFREPRLATYCDMMLELHGKNVSVMRLELEDGRSYTFTKDNLSKVQKVKEEQN